MASCRKTKFPLKGLREFFLKPESTYQAFETMITKYGEFSTAIGEVAQRLQYLRGMPKLLV